MGSAPVIAQNVMRANKNAERLHGASTGWERMNSPVVAAVSHTSNKCEEQVQMDAKKRNRKKNRNVNNSVPRVPNNNQNSRQGASLADPMIPRRLKGMRKQMRSQISREAADWLVAALDPFHDSKRTIAGYPDMDGSSSVVSGIAFQMEIKCPAGLASAYDAHIFTLPQVIQKGVKDQTYAASQAGSVTQAAMATNMTFGAVNAITAKSGELLFPTTAAWAPANFEYQNCGPSAGSYGGQSRLVGWGIEVINTSPNLYKSGNLIMYRQSQRASRSTVKVNDATVGALITGTTAVRKYRRPPSSAAEAMLLPGSLSWEAKEGAYMPVTQSGIENPADTFCYENAQYGDTSEPAAAAEYTTGSSITGGAAVAAEPIVYAHKYVPYDTCGVVLTGLDPSSSFAVKVKMYWEKFPSVNDPVLLPLATPSAQYDVRALELYSRTLYNLPLGTISANNASGEWFSELWNKLYSIAGPIANLIPGLGGIADAVYGVGDKLIKGVGSALPFIP